MLLDELGGESRTGRLRKFEPIEVKNNVKLSIQAGEGIYSRPQKMLDKHDYEAFEVAIFKNGNMVIVEDVSNDEGIIKKMNAFYDGIGVYGYVPVEVVQELYEQLN